MELRWVTPYNIIFGGIGAISNSRELLAEKLVYTSATATPISPSDITYFEVKGNDVYANIGLNKGVRTGGFNNRSDLTYVKDLGAIKNLEANSFRLAANLLRVDLDFVTSITTTAFTNTPSLAYISLKKCKSITASNFYDIKKRCEIHVNDTLASPLNAQLSAAITNYNAKIYFYNDAGFLTSTLNT